jgi:predicted ATPase
MVYLKEFILPSDAAETGVIEQERGTWLNTFYPFKIFPLKQLRYIEFDCITLFCGGNGSGKSTLINVMAQKLNAMRYSDFNGSPLFDTFVDLCEFEYYKRPRGSCVLTSDDVFDHALNMRAVNWAREERRNALFERHGAIARAANSAEFRCLKGLDDFERWSEVHEVLSDSQSNYIKKRMGMDVDLYSNGETALRYFLDKIDNDALYFLDEPENSLSVDFQRRLADYIAATAIATKSQFVIATHSPIFLSMKGARIYNLDECPVDVCNWTELPNVRRYFDFFMEHREEFD